MAALLLVLMMTGMLFKLTDLSFTFFGHIHSDKNQYGAKDEIDSDLFCENQPGKNNGGDGG